jgi:hypothetical protein
MERKRKSLGKRTVTGDRDFDPWWRAQSDRLRAYIAVQTDRVERETLAAQGRHRRLQARHREGFNRRVEAVLSDLIRLALSGSRGGITISRSSAYLTCRRYRHELVETKELVRVLEDLERTGLVVSVKGTGRRKRYLPKGERADAPEDRATITLPGKALLEAIREGRWSMEDLKRDRGGEVLVLKRTKRYPKEDPPSIDYLETEETTRLRHEVERVNEWIEGFDLTMDEEPGGWPYDMSSRRLRRQFSHGTPLNRTSGDAPGERQRWDRGGRIWGGSWEGMRKSDRHRLRINGQHIAIVDYGQLFGRILFAMAGEEAPERDLYLVPGLERHRDGVKKLLNSLLFKEGELKGFPKGVGGMFPNGMKASEAISTVKAAFAPIARYFGTAVGHRLLYRESQLMMSVLQTCMETGLPALPCHDAIFLAEESWSQGRIIMTNEYAKAFGSAAVVEVEWPSRPGTTTIYPPLFSLV